MIGSAKKLIEIEENLKGRVAMELHDLTSPFYTTMLHQIEKAQIKDYKIRTDLEIKLSTMAENIRQISHRMNNSFLEQLSIKEHVNGLCNDLQGTINIPIRCVISQNDFNFSIEETIHIYRIVQELLTNAVKYVTFGEISLSLSQEEGMFFILYKDSGPGFDVKNTINSGLGIRNIYERAKIINGKAVLHSVPRKGTSWNIIIPYNQITQGSTLKEKE
jgi:two-component system NarL family sensor kinase